MKKALAVVEDYSKEALIAKRDQEMDTFDIGDDDVLLNSEFGI